MFNFLQITSWLASIAFCFYYGRKIGMSKLKSVLCTIFSIVFFHMFMLFQAWVESGFQNFGAQNLVRVFAFAPIIFILEAKIFKVSFRTMSDFHAIWPMLLHGISHYACFFVGCCNGYQYVEGSLPYKIAYALTGTNELPNQIFESTAALIVTLILFIIAKKKNFNTNGRLYYIMLVIFGAQRTLWEFLRNNQKVIVFGKMPNAVNGDFGISNLACYSILMVLVGIGFLIAYHIIDKKKAAKEQETKTEVTVTE